MWIALQPQHSLYFLSSQIFFWICKAVWFWVASPPGSIFYGLWAAGIFLFSPLFAPESHHSLEPAYFCNCRRIFIFSKSFTRQLLVPGYQEIWYTADGDRKSSSPANNVRLGKCSHTLGWSCTTCIHAQLPANGFCLAATLFLPWGGSRRGWFKCRCEHLLRTQVEKSIFGHSKLIPKINCDRFSAKKEQQKSHLYINQFMTNHVAHAPLGWCMWSQLRHHIWRNCWRKWPDRYMQMWVVAPLLVLWSHSGQTDNVTGNSHMEWAG